MPAPHRRNQGESLATKIEGHAAPRSISDRRDRLRSQAQRDASKWETVAADLNRATGSTLEHRAKQARTDYERSGQYTRYDTDVKRGRAKPPIIVLTPNAAPRYYLGPCLDCSVELWVHRAKPRVPLCAHCRDKRA